jgi:hypothetical protein
MERKKVLVTAYIKIVGTRVTQPPMGSEGRVSGYNFDLAALSSPQTYNTEASYVRVRFHFHHKRVLFRKMEVKNGIRFVLSTRYRGIHNATTLA